jgi:hypothetical protein
MNPVSLINAVSFFNFSGSIVDFLSGFGLPSSITSYFISPSSFIVKISVNCEPALSVTPNENIFS